LIESPDSQEIPRPEADDNFEDKHELGSVGMSLDSSSTQFYVALGKCDWLDGLMHVVGRVCEGSEKEKILKIMESCPTVPGGRPKFDIRVCECGQF
jgi:cyclophilin family peptidyl-prolyl cis-trans isomerase